MLDLLLRRLGWDVINLGADVPIKEIDQAIGSARPHLVILAAQQLNTAGSLLEMTEAIRSKDTAVAFGGGIFNRAPALRKRIPGHFLGATLEEATQMTESLMVSAHQVPSPERPPQAYGQTLSCCLDELLALEAGVWTALETIEFDRVALRELNGRFSDTLIAGLRFGDVSLVGDYLDWLEGMGSQQRLPTEVLHQYLEGYRQAAEEHLGEGGELIINWLDDRLDEDARLEESAR
jgi:hypothetical protein